MAIEDKTHVWSLFENQTADVTTDKVVLNGQTNHSISLTGTPDGAIVHLEAVNSNGDWSEIEGSRFTDSVSTRFFRSTGKSMGVRAVLSNVGGTTDLTLEISK